MFENAGGKIKLVAFVLCILGIVASVFYGIFVFVQDSRLFFSGLVIMLVGSVCSWIVALFAYGFGQLIENSDVVIEHLEQGSGEKAVCAKEKFKKTEGVENSSAKVAVKKTSEVLEITPPVYDETEEKEFTNRCLKCGNFYNETVCPYCSGEETK